MPFVLRCGIAMSARALAQSRPAGGTVCNKNVGALLSDGGRHARSLPFDALLCRKEAHSRNEYIFPCVAGVAVAVVHVGVAHAVAL